MKFERIAEAKVMLKSAPEDERNAEIQKIKDECEQVKQERMKKL